MPASIPNDPVIDTNDDLENLGGNGSSASSAHGYSVLAANNDGGQFSARCPLSLGGSTGSNQIFPYNLFLPHMVNLMPLQSISQEKLDNLVFVSVFISWGSFRASVLTVIREVPLFSPFKKLPRYATNCLAMSSVMLFNLFACINKSDTQEARPSSSSDSSTNDSMKLRNARLILMVITGSFYGFNVLDDAIGKLKSTSSALQTLGGILEVILACGTWFCNGAMAVKNIGAMTFFDKLYKNILSIFLGAILLSSQYAFLCDLGEYAIVGLNLFFSFTPLSFEFGKEVVSIIDKLPQQSIFQCNIPVFPNFSDACFTMIDSAIVFMLSVFYVVFQAGTVTLSPIGSDNLKLAIALMQVCINIPILLKTSTEIVSKGFTRAAVAAIGRRLWRQDAVAFDGGNDYFIAEIESESASAVAVAGA